MHKVGINLGKIKEILPYGAITEIAKESKTSIDTVRRVLKGKSENRRVLNALKGYVKGLKETKEEINSTANILFGDSQS